MKRSDMFVVQFSRKKGSIDNLCGLDRTVVEKDSWNGDIVYVSIFEGWYIRGKQKRSLENEGGIFALNGLA